MIGFTSVSLRKYSVYDVVKAAADAKADFIEWGSDVHIKTPDNALLAKKLCDENGIAINSYGTYYRIGSFEHKEWENICECAALMDAKFIRTWLGTRGSAVTTRREYEKLLTDARFCCGAAAEKGLVVSNECHPNTYNDTTASSLEFLNDIGCENMKTYYQSWYREEKEDKEKLVKLFSYVTDVHVSFSELVKFQRFHKKDPDFIKKILMWLKELDFQGGIMIEFTENNTPADLINDVERLRELWKNA